MTPPLSKRIDTDVMKLMRAGFEVELVEENSFKNLVVKFHGLKDSLYEGGEWKVKVKLADGYPDKPPYVKFMNKIYHPNISVESGRVCVDVLDKKWINKYDLLKVFEMFLPHLLQNPNPEDPLNLDAAVDQLFNRPVYDQTVKDYVERYAKPGVVEKSSEEETDDGIFDDSDWDCDHDHHDDDDGDGDGDEGKSVEKSDDDDGGKSVEKSDDDDDDDEKSIEKSDDEDGKSIEKSDDGKSVEKSDDVEAAGESDQPKVT